MGWVEEKEGRKIERSIVSGSMELGKQRNVN